MQDFHALSSNGVGEPYHLFQATGLDPAARSILKPACFEGRKAPEVQKGQLHLVGLHGSQVGLVEQYRIPAMGRQVLPESFRLLALGRNHYLTRVQIHEGGEGMVSSLEARVVDCSPANRDVADRVPGPIDIIMDPPPDPSVNFPAQAQYRSQRHTLRGASAPSKR